MKLGAAALNDKEAFPWRTLTGVWRACSAPAPGTCTAFWSDSRLRGKPESGAVAAHCARRPIPPDSLLYAVAELDGAACSRRVPAGAWRPCARLHSDTRLWSASCGLRAGNPISERWRCSPAPRSDRERVVEVPAQAIVVDSRRYAEPTGPRLHKSVSAAERGALSLARCGAGEVADGDIDAAGPDVQRVFVGRPRVFAATT